MITLFDELRAGCDAQPAGSVERAVPRSAAGSKEMRANLGACVPALPVVSLPQTAAAGFLSATAKPAADFLEGNT